MFFAFSTFVMTALGRLPDRQGLLAIQEVNDAAPTPWFTLPWIGTAAVCVALVRTAWNHVRTLVFLAAAIFFVVALVARRSETTSTPSRPVGERAGAADLVESGVPR